VAILATATNMTRQQKAELRKINFEALVGTPIFFAFMVITLSLWATIS
jgi:hypothetical protein